MQVLDTKLVELNGFIADKGRNGVVVAFSGGVDSSTLAVICHRILGNRAVAVIAQSPVYTQAEMREAKQIAQDIGIKLFVVLTEQLENADFTRNPENRCYFCKKELLQKLKAFGNKHGFKTVFEGTNFSDLRGHRPGFRAVQESEGVYSPWVECKFSNEEICAIAKDMGLGVYNKPAAACLATRIPFNEEITAQKLGRVEEAEGAIREIVNVQQLRVRDHNGLARIEVGPYERELFFRLDVIDAVVQRLKRLGFVYVTFDLEGYRSGSMLEVLNRST